MAVTLTTWWPGSVTKLKCPLLSLTRERALSIERVAAGMDLFETESKMLPETLTCAVFSPMNPKREMSASPIRVKVIAS
jgi:hypothetical protein